MLLVAPTRPPDDLLNRIGDARHAGAVILSIDAGDPDLHAIAHDTLTLADSMQSQTAATAMAGIGVTVDTIEQLVSLTTAEPTSASDNRRSVIQRLGRILDHSGSR